MSAEDLFFEEWRACLRAHYQYVVRTEDEVTEPTLREVLQLTGLSAKEIEALYEEARALGPLTPEELAALENHAGEEDDEASANAPNPAGTP